MSRKHIKSVLLLLLLLLPPVLQAQSLSQFQYWFDDDFAGRQTGSISGTATTIERSIDTEHLEVGLHKFNIRFRRTDGTYTAVSTSTFQKVASGHPNLLEYWFDGDQSTSKIMNGEVTYDQDGFKFVGDVDIASLDVGVHDLYFRAVSGNGLICSAVSVARFQKLTNGETKWLEYWFDGDRENVKRIEGNKASDGNGYTFVNQVDVSELEVGPHNLFMRAVNNDGLVTTAVSVSPFQKMTNGEIKWLEYWIDGDIDNAQRLPAVTANGGKEFRIVTDIDFSSLPVGQHRISMRGVNQDGLVSTAVTTTPFIKQGTGVVENLECWLDNNRSNSKTVSGHLASTGDAYVFVDGLDLSDAAPGYHKLHFRALGGTNELASAVTTSAIMVKPLYGEDATMSHYTIAVDDGVPETFPITKNSNEVNVFHTLDASSLEKGSHNLTMSFWNSALKSVTESATFIADATKFQLATPDCTTFNVSNVNETGFTAAWNAVEGAKYYDIAVAKDGEDFDHPNFTGSTTKPTAEVTKLEPGLSYRFKVRARNDNWSENSEWSETNAQNVITAQQGTMPANLVIRGLNGIDGTYPLTTWSTYTYNAWVVNNGKSPWYGSFYLKDGDEDIKGWHNIFLSKNSVQVLECSYTPKSPGTKNLVLYYQTGGNGAGIPVLTPNNTNNVLTLVVNNDPTYNENIKLARAIVCPESSETGKTENITAYAINHGDMNWTGKLCLKDNGLTIAEKSVTMEAGRGKTVSASWTPETPGMHEISVYYMSAGGSSWQLLSDNGFDNPAMVDVANADALNDANKVYVTNVTHEVTPTEVTKGSTVFYYFRLEDSNKKRLKGMKMHFICSNPSQHIEKAYDSSVSDDNGIAVLEIKTEGSNAVANRGETVSLTCESIHNFENKNIPFEVSPGNHMYLTIHQGTTASEESGFENVEKMKFTLDLGVSAKASLGNYIKLKGNLALPLSLEMKFDDNGGFKDYVYDSKIKAGLNVSEGNFGTEKEAQDFAKFATIFKGSIGSSIGFHYNFSSSDWHDIFIRLVMRWCENFKFVDDWKKDLIIKVLNECYAPENGWKETTNYFMNFDVSGSVDILNSLGSFDVIKPNKKRGFSLPSIRIPTLGLKGQLSLGLDWNIKKEDFGSTNRWLVGDAATYKLEGEFSFQAQVRNIFKNSSKWWKTLDNNSTISSQLDKFFLSSPTNTYSPELKGKTSEMFDYNNKLQEVSHEMSFSNNWTLSNELNIGSWSPLEGDIGITSTSSQKLSSKGDWANYIGDLTLSCSQDNEIVNSIYPNLQTSSLIAAPIEYFRLWNNPPTSAIEQLAKQAPSHYNFNLKDAIKVENTLSSELFMSASIPFFKWDTKLLGEIKFAIDAGLNFNIDNKSTASYYSFADKRFFPISVHPTTSITKIVEWAVSSLSDKFRALFEDDRDMIETTYEQMSDVTGTGSVAGVNTRIIVPALSEYYSSDDGGSWDSQFSSCGRSHYKLNDFNNNYAKYILSRHPQLGEKVQTDICYFTFDFNKDIQNFDEGLQIRIGHHYPAGDLLGITDEGDTLFVVSEVCNVMVFDGDSLLMQTQRGEYEVTGSVGVDDLTPFGFPENQPLDVYFCENDSNIWHYVGPAGGPIKVDKLGAFMMGTSIKNDEEPPVISFTLNEATGLAHINAIDNIGIRFSSLKVLVNGQLREVDLIDNSNFELMLTTDDMEHLLVIEIVVEDLAGNVGCLFQVFNLDKPEGIDIVSQDGSNAEISLGRNVLIVKGAKPFSVVTVYDLNGRIWARTTADRDGNVNCGMNDLMRGPYIVTLSEGKAKKLYVN